MHNVPENNASDDLISVIIPVYNVEPYLLRCVDSVRRQTYSNLEILLVDDESPDNCPQMCEELKKQDPRIKVIHKKNGGLGYARNTGLENATGTYVTFLDSDDWISDDHINVLYRAIKASDSDAALGSHTSVDPAGVSRIHPLELETRLYENEEIVSVILLPLIVPDVDYPRDIQISSSCCMNLYRMDIIRKQNLRFLSERYAVSEDLYFNIDYLYHAQRVTVTGELGYFYYENPGSISRKRDPKQFEKTLNFYTTVRAQVERYALQDAVAYRIERCFLMKTRVAVRMIVLSDQPAAEKLRQIREILEHETTQTVLQTYPIETYIPAMRLLAKLMRGKHTVGVYCLMKCREAAKQQHLLKAVLGLRGSGRQ